MGVTRENFPRATLKRTAKKCVNEKFVLNHAAATDERKTTWVDRTRTCSSSEKLKGCKGTKTQERREKIAVGIKFYFHTLHFFILIYLFIFSLSRIQWDRGFARINFCFVRSLGILLDYCPSVMCMFPAITFLPSDNHFVEHILLLEKARSTWRIPDCNDIRQWISNMAVNRNILWN